MTVAPLPAEWSELSAGDTRYEIMHRTHEIAHISPEKFYNKIDIQGFDDFIGDLYLQLPVNYVGMILFDGEIEIVGEFCRKFLAISGFHGQAPVDQIEQLIADAKHLFAEMSKHGEIEVL